MTQGVIVKGVGGFYYVATAQGQYECRARGKFRHQRITPSVGDWVKISVLDEEAKKGSLDEILPRKNALLRPRVVNVDQAVIVFAAKSPDPNVDLSYVSIRLILMPRVATMLWQPFTGR